MTQSHAIEVYQPRDTRSMLTDDGTGVRDGFTDLFHDIRDARCGMLDAGDIDTETLGRLYDLVGGETISGEFDGDADALHHVFGTWQNVEGRDQSPVFRARNDEHRAVSMSTGDIVRIDGRAYLCDFVGWSRIDALGGR